MSKMNIFRRIKFCEKRISKYAEIVNELIVQCFAYPNEDVYRHYWVDKLSNRFDIINSVRVSKKRKLSASAYRKYLFYYFGNELSDAETNMKEYRITNLDRLHNGKEYHSDFIVSNDKIKHLFEAYNLVSEKYSEIFANRNNTMTAEDFKYELLDDFKEILKN